MLVVLWLGACSYIPIDDPDTAQLSDVTSTAIGVTNGFAEANPLAAPMANAGPVGWLTLAGMKLGLNRLAEQQAPASCRRLLAFNTALGWGATVNNLAIIAAPQLAIFALPAAFGAYAETERGSALRTCYADRLIEVVLAVPENIDHRTIPHDIADGLAGSNFRPLQGTVPAGGRLLIHGYLVADVEGFQALLERTRPDWAIVGAWRQRQVVVPVRLALLLSHLPSPPARQPVGGRTAAVDYELRSGKVTLHTPGESSRTIAVVPRKIAVAEF